MRPRRGHPVERVDGRIVYVDTGEPVADYDNETRPCVFCGKPPTPEGHDACIPNLSDVRAACCGHGDNELAYIDFADGRQLHGQRAAALMGVASWVRGTS